MTKKKVGIRDISERAGVALSTVSHALNGTAPISDEVRNRVLAIAQEMGYLAKRQAKGSIAALQNVMVIVPEGALPDSDVNLVSWTILSALTRDCETRGIKVMPFPITNDHSPADVAAAIVKGGIDGIILINDDREELLAAIGATAVPAVLINGEDPNMLMDSVTPGNRFAAMKAAKWLVEMGHQKILHVTWKGRKTVSRRLAGFVGGCDEMGLPEASREVLVADGYEPHFGEAAVRDWLEQHPDLDGFTAIFCAADNLAFGAIKALHAHGLRVPDDISVMGFDGVALGGLHAPPLTTISVPLDQFGAEALRLLEQRKIMQRDQRAAHRLELGCTIVERKSVSRPKKR